MFNDKHPTTDPVTGEALAPVPFHATSQGFSGPSGQALPTLNLPRVAVLTSANTCSASESIVNGLRGVGVQVIEVGSTTCGKPYGFYPQDNCGTTYFSIEFQGVNDQGFGDYPDGFSPANATGTVGVPVPGCSVADDFTHALGDPHEARLAAALGYLADQGCPAVTAAPSAAGRGSGAVRPTGCSTGRPGARTASSGGDPTRRLTGVVGVAGTLLLAACHPRSAPPTCPPSSRTRPRESRAELVRVVSAALNGAPVTIADDALTGDDTLIVERAPVATPRACPSTGARPAGRSASGWSRTARAACWCTSRPAGAARWRRRPARRAEPKSDAAGPGRPEATRACFRRFPSSHRADAYCSLKLIVTVMTTGTGTPFSSVGVYSHCRTASSAA